RAADHERNVRLLQLLQRADVEVGCGIVDAARGGRLHDGPQDATASVARRPRGCAARSDGSTWNTRNGGRSAATRVRSGLETLYTGAPLFVRPSSRPRCAWPCSTIVTG